MKKTKEKLDFEKCELSITYAKQKIRLSGYSLLAMTKRDNISIYPNKRKINIEKHRIKQLAYVPLILNSCIDFTKFGWSGNVASILNCKPQKVNIWMKKYMPDFYKTCFQRNSDKTKSFLNV